MRSVPDLASRADEYVRLALAGDRSAALALVLEPLEAGAPLAEVYDRLLGVACGRVGELWHRGDISVAEEHYATRIAQEAMALARATVPAARPRCARVVLACPSDEQHELGLRMLADVLGADGWDVRLLGGATPSRDLVAYVEKVDASAVGLSCSTALAVPSLIHAVEALRAARPGIRVLLGGRAAERYDNLLGASGADRAEVRLRRASEALAELLAA